MKRHVYTLLVGATLVSCAVVTPEDETRGHMMATFIRIGKYARLHGSLPSSLEGLPEYERVAWNEPIDGWNRPLQYRVDNEGIITLTSFGKDGKTGGWGFNADFSMSYHSRRKDGTLWAGEEEWILQGKIMK